MGEDDVEKIAIITDTHCGARNDSPIFNDYFLKFYKDIFFPYLRKNKIKTVLHLGDVFDRRKYINFNTLDSWKKNVFSVLNEEFETHIIVGNHDSYFKNTIDLNSLEQLLSEYNAINVIKTPTIFKFKFKDILLVPWITPDEEEKTKELVQRYKGTICGHFEIMGFDVLDGHPNEINGFGPDVFENAELVLSGHYHGKSSNGKINYLGTPYQITWSDYGQAKGFHILDPETSDLTFIENPYTIFKKIEYKPGTKIDFSEVSGSFVKLIVSERDTKFQDFFAELEKNNPADLKIIDISLGESDSEELEIDEAKDTLTIIKEYCEQKNIAEKDLVFDLMTEIYKTAIDTQNITC